MRNFTTSLRYYSPASQKYLQIKLFFYYFGNTINEGMISSPNRLRRLSWAIVRNARSNLKIIWISCSWWPIRSDVSYRCFWGHDLTLVSHIVPLFRWKRFKWGWVEECKQECTSLDGLVPLSSLLPQLHDAYERCREWESHQVTDDPSNAQETSKCVCLLLDLSQSL